MVIRRIMNNRSAFLPSRLLVVGFVGAGLWACGQSNQGDSGGTGASLTGRNTVASIGFNVAYRSTL